MEANCEMVLKTCLIIFLLLTLPTFVLSRFFLTEGSQWMLKALFIASVFLSIITTRIQEWQEECVSQQIMEPDDNDQFFVAPDP